MNCPNDKVIEMYLNCVLPSFEAAAIEKHISVCSECAAKFESLRSVDEALRKAVQPNPGADYWAALPARLSARAKSEKRTGMIHGHALLKLKTAMWLAIEIAAMFFIFLTFSLLSSLKTQNMNVFKPYIPFENRIEETRDSDNRTGINISLSVNFHRCTEDYCK